MSIARESTLQVTTSLHMVMSHSLWSVQTLLNPHSPPFGTPLVVRGNPTLGTTSHMEFDTRRACHEFVLWGRCYGMPLLLAWLLWIPEWFSGIQSVLGAWMGGVGWQAWSGVHWHEPKWAQCMGGHVNVQAINVTECHPCVCCTATIDPCAMVLHGLVPRPKGGFCRGRGFAW